MSTDRRFIEDLNALVDPTSTRRLPEAQERGPIQSGLGYVEGDDPTRLAPGIASPLTEIESTEAQPSRVYHADDASLVSTDGLFVLTGQALARLRMTDANGAPVEMVLRHPDTGDLPE